MRNYVDLCIIYKNTDCKRVDTQARRPPYMLVTERGDVSADDFSMALIYMLVTERGDVSADDFSMALISWSLPPLRRSLVS